jgi:dephospho-coA kinase
MVIGIFGGIGSGKSLVLNILKNDYAAYVIEADKKAHELYRIGEDTYKKLLELCSDKILNSDKSINRKVLADLLYNDKELLAKVNSIVHPGVWEMVEKETLEKQKEFSYVVVEAAILPDKKYDIYDETWYIYSDETTRRKRLKESRAYSDKQIDIIIEKQASEEEYCRFADRVIENNSSPEQLKYKIAMAMEDIVEKKKSHLL